METGEKEKNELLFSTMAKKVEKWLLMLERTKRIPNKRKIYLRRRLLLLQEAVKEKNLELIHFYMNTISRGALWNKLFSSFEEKYCEKVEFFGRKCDPLNVSIEKE